MLLSTWLCHNASGVWLSLTPTQTLPRLPSPTTGADRGGLPWKPGWWCIESRRSSHPRCLKVCSCPPRSRSGPLRPGANSLLTYSGRWGEKNVVFIVFVNLCCYDGWIWWDWCISIIMYKADKGSRHEVIWKIWSTPLPSQTPRLLPKNYFSKSTTVALGGMFLIMTYTAQIYIKTDLRTM